MFSKDKKKVKAKNGVADTLIARDTKITGDLRFAGVLFVDGFIKGDVMATQDESLMTIGPKGKVQGDIKVPYIHVHGEVIGNVYSSEQVELFNSAIIKGNLFYHDLEMHMGAEINGKMVRKEQMPKLALDHKPDSEEENEKKVEKRVEPQLSKSKGPNTVNAEDLADKVKID